MIQSQAVFSQSQQEFPSQDLIEDPYDLEEFSYSNSEEFEDSSEYDQDTEEDFYEDDEEEDEDLREYLKWFRLPKNTKKFDPKEQKMKAEKARVRNEKFEAIRRERELLHFLPESNHSVSFKKLNEFSRTRSAVRNICHIPERNLLLVVLMNGKTLHVYSTTNFKLVVIKNLKNEVSAIRYSKDLDKILVGGAHYIVELFNPMTFEVEAESSHQPYYYLSYFYYFPRQHDHAIHTVEYIPKYNIIVAAIKSTVIFYDTNLKFLQEFSPPAYLGHWEPFASEIVPISRKRLLIPCRYERQKILVLLNLKTGTTQTYQGLYIPDVSSIEMTEHDNLKIFTCLVSFQIARPSEFYYPPASYKLTQMAFCSKTEEFVVYRRTASPYSFISFRKIEGSKFFLAEERIGWDESRKVLLTINKGKIEMVKVISEPWSGLGKCLMMVRDEFCMVEISSLNRISVSGMVFQKGAKNKELEELEDSD